MVSTRSKSWVKSVVYIRTLVEVGDVGHKGRRGNKYVGTNW